MAMNSSEKNVTCCHLKPTAITPGRERTINAHTCILFVGTFDVQEYYVVERNKVYKEC